MGRLVWDRRGIGILGIVLFMCTIASVVVIAYHALGRAGTRTLFSVHENRQLAQLARSALAEAYHTLQSALDRGQDSWFDWCTAEGDAPNETISPSLTREGCARMTTDRRALEYTVGDVRVRRVRGLDAARTSTSSIGIVDLAATVRVRRRSPYHEAGLRMVERRYCWLADDLDPLGSGGRHIELAPTPTATQVEVP